MSARELIDRVELRVGDLADRMGAGRSGASGVDPDRLLAPAYSGNDWQRRLLAARRERPPSFFASFDDPATMRSVILREHAQEWRRTCLEADRVRRHEFEFFGATFRYDEIDWQADPVSRLRWPDAWHRSIDVTGLPPADVKHVWELSRHQFLIDLGMRYWIGGDAADAAEALAIVRHWIQRNPYGRGVNWASPLEPAYRALSWLWAYHFCLDAPDLGEEVHAEWLRSFHDHGRFLYRHLELYASPFNHLIGEATILYLLGLLMPEFRDAAAWRERGRRVLIERLADQFHSDGGTVEQATFYHHATLGFYLMAALLARRNGDDLPESIWRAIEKAIEFSMYLVQPDGRVPMIGDTDDAKPIRLEHRRFWDFRAFQAMGAVLFNRADFKHVAGGFPEDALWLLGADGRERFNRIDSAPPANASVALRDSGYFILRSDWSSSADYACVDCGEQAGGLRHDAVPSAAHGHADCLSMTVFLGGRPVLVDSGFYTYNGDESWERHFRETAAHNTARIDNRDQARHLSKMDWCEVPRPRLEQWSGDIGEGACVVGSHDGYVDGANGIVHRRTTWLRPDGYLLIYDEFIGTEGEGHTFELNYQLAPGILSDLGATTLVTGDGIEFCWLGSPTLAASLTEGGEGPGQGWIAPSLGVRLPAARLSLYGALRRRHEVVLTVIADRSAGRVRRIRIDALPTQEGEPLAVQVCSDTHVDHIVGTCGRAATGAFETDAMLAIWRASESGVVGAARVGGTYMRIRTNSNTAGVRTNARRSLRVDA